MSTVRVIGGGLAGSEAAWQLAQRGVQVDLYEQKGVRRHPAFQSDDLAELICSNSLRSDNPENAVGLLKNELRELGSLIMASADQHRVPAGSSLAVDRVGFSQEITEKILSHPLITLHREEVTDIDLSVPTILACGPLLEGELAERLAELIHQDSLYFYDAVAPIVTRDSVDLNSAYYKSRYDDENPGDYINCPLSKEEFFTFYQELVSAKTIEVREMDREIYFEGCMPIEAMAKRGMKTMLFGPLKPVGLEKDGKRPYAVVQLRRDDALDSLYNLVGFQTHLTFPEQKRVFSLIPALKNAQFVRYGVMHRNTYMNSPHVLNAHYGFRDYPLLYAAGQLTGVEGYIESTASGCYAALSLYRQLQGKEIVSLSRATMIGAMASYVSNPATGKLVPMNANFGIFQDPADVPAKEKKHIRVERALQEVRNYRERLAE